jgi:nitroreductase
MKTDFPVEETIRTRRSVRSYEKRALPPEQKAVIESYIMRLSNPFSIEVSFHLLDSETSEDRKLGTYGMIKGAKNFIAASVIDEEFALEALGYSFEKLILYSTSLGLGTCWLGGTFNRNSFATAMDLKKDELCPAVSPIGYPMEKKRALDSFTRWVAKSNQRKDWRELFFTHDFSQPLSPSDENPFTFPLEMLRLAPSAANRQPWRIMQDGDAYHFYKEKSTKESTSNFDIQRVDIGIAACHFHLATIERDLPGRFEKISELPSRVLSNELEYCFSWVID